MLVGAHVGYTIGSVWAAQRIARRKPPDYRVIAIMAMLPDLVDRFLYAFVLPDAQGGRLIAHTLLFNLALLALLMAVKKGFWIYGLASLGHLLLNGDGLTLQHVFWPLLGADLAHIGIAGGGLTTASYGQQVIDRVRQILNTYGEAQLGAILFEAGGLLALALFALCEGLYRPAALWRFLATGMSKSWQLYEAHTVWREDIS